jgi:guanylate kinase
MTKIIALLGPSGVGKGLLKSYLIKQATVDFIVPKVFTTRPSRKDDLDNNKVSISQEEFEFKVQEGTIIYPHLIRYSSGYLYGFSRDDLALYPANNLLIELYPPLLELFKNKYQKGLISFALLASKNRLTNNLMRRETETEFSLNDRIKLGQKEEEIILNFNKLGYIDYLYYLDNLSEEVVKLKYKIFEIILSE